MVSVRHRLAVGAAVTVLLSAAAWCWHEATRIHTVVITVPDGHGFFAAWIRESHPDVVEVTAGVATFSVPQGGLLRAKSMSCLRGWHVERYVDPHGEPVDDVQSLGTMVSSSWDGVVQWWYRGAETDVMHSSEARQVWLRKQGIAR